MKDEKMELSPEQREELLRALKARFEKNMNRHKDFEWDVFIYHNSAPSYYGVRAFRGSLRV